MPADFESARAGKPKLKARLRLCCSCLMLACGLVLLYCLASVFKANLASDRSAYLKAAIERDAVQCYAIEGAYPKDLAHLEDYYGLQVDRNSYDVYYQSLGSNLKPQVIVVRVSGR